MGETIDFEARRKARIRAFTPTTDPWPTMSDAIDEGATTIADAVLQFVTDIRAEQGEEPSRADIERACRFYGLAQSALEEVRDGMVEQLKE